MVDALNYYCYQDVNGHILECNGEKNMSRMIYCDACGKLVSKRECEKMRKNQYGKLYAVKRYSHTKQATLERKEKKEQKAGKRLMALPKRELSSLTSNQKVRNVDIRLSRIEMQIQYLEAQREQLLMTKKYDGFLS